MFDLSGKVALVTGAGQGMGTGMAKALAAQGATVAVNDLFPERAQSTYQQIIDAGHKAIAAAFDVTDVSAVTAAVEGITAAVGSVDILVNNAGIPPTGNGGLFRKSQPDGWRPYINLNIYGSLNCIYSVINGMCERHWGRVIQISSGTGRNGVSYGVSIYGASKAGIEGFIRHLSQEVAADGVTANVIALGRMNNHLDAAPSISLPVGRFGTPEDAGAVVVYFASNESGFVTGQTIGLNGGRFMN
jgi:3-oxoacyl-[acyl-carrier protein] reductase